MAKLWVTTEPGLFYGTKAMYIFHRKYICVSETEQKTKKLQNKQYASLLLQRKHLQFRKQHVQSYLQLYTEKYIVQGQSERYWNTRSNMFKDNNQECSE